MLTHSQGLLSISAWRIYDNISCLLIGANRSGEDEIVGLPRTWYAWIWWIVYVSENNFVTNHTFSPSLRTSHCLFPHPWFRHCVYQMCFYSKPAGNEGERAICTKNVLLLHLLCWRLNHWIRSFQLRYTSINHWLFWMKHGFPLYTHLTITSSLYVLVAFASQFVSNVWICWGCTDLTIRLHGRTGYELLMKYPQSSISKDKVIDLLTRIWVLWYN